MVLGCRHCANNATDYRDLQADMSLAIVIGSEGQGMSRLVSDKCDFTLKYLWSVM